MPPTSEAIDTMSARVKSVGGFSRAAYSTGQSGPKPAPVCVLPPVTPPTGSPKAAGQSLFWAALMPAMKASSRRSSNGPSLG